MTAMKTRALRLPIIAGPLRGRWWLPASRGKVLRILNGTYEREQTRFFQEWIRPGDTVLDVGAHVGYYTLLASTLIGDTGTVWAFEPQPRNCRFLVEHARINGCTNVHVESSAVSNVEGTARFAAGTGSGTGRLAQHGTLDVHTVRLDTFCTRHNVLPAALKIDVEGAEAAVLEGAGTLLDTARPVIFLSTHGGDLHASCLDLLRRRSYHVRAITGESVQTATELLCLPDDHRS